MWTDFWDGFSEQYQLEVHGELELHKKVIDYLQREGWFYSGDRVIDVGCGPGTYPLLMAKWARWITCLDSSDGMLQRLKEEAVRAQIYNIDLRLERWEDAGFESKYDLAMCARSPAIRGREGLLKLEEASSRSCCFIAGASQGEGKEWREIWELVIGRYPEDSGNGCGNYNLVNPFNILLEEGRNPDLKHIFGMVDVSLDADMVISNMKSNLRIYTRLTKAEERAVEERVLSWCDHGRYRMRRQRGVAVITWTIPGV